MSTLIPCLRWYFGAAAALLGPISACGLWLAADAWRRGLDPGWLLLVLAPAGCVLSIFNAIAWKQLERGGEAARRWAWRASFANLAFFPLGTLAGLAGLRAFRKNLDRLKPAVVSRHSEGSRGVMAQWSLQAIQWALVWIWFSGLQHWAAGRGLNPSDDLLPEGMALLGATALAAIYHHFGHIVGAWACEFSVRALRVGPFVWRRVEGRSRFEMVPVLIGGAVKALPTKPGALRTRAIFVCLAGPAGSLLFAAIFFVLLAQAKGSAWEPVWMLVELVAILCASDALCQLLPVGPDDGSYSDGALLWQLVRNTRAGEYYVFSLYRGLSTTTRLSPSEWPSDGVEEASAVPVDEMSRLRERLLALIHYRMKGLLTPAHRHYCSMLQSSRRLADGEVEAYAPEFAFYEALYAGRPTLAREWLERMPEFQSRTALKALSAVLAAEGDIPGARDAWEKGWPMVTELPDCGMRKVEEHDFRLLAEQWFPDLTNLAEALRVQTGEVVRV